MFVTIQHGAVITIFGVRQQHRARRVAVGVRGVGAVHEPGAVGLESGDLDHVLDRRDPPVGVLVLTLDDRLVRVLPGVRVGQVPDQRRDPVGLEREVRLEDPRPLAALVVRAAAEPKSGSEAGAYVTKVKGRPKALFSLLRTSYP